MRRLLVSTLLAVGMLGAQTFDNSATGSYKGNYYVRQVLLSGIDVNSGAIGRARSLTGTATLDGTGKYTLTGTLMDSQGGSSQAYNATGTIVVAPNGLFQMQNALESKSILDGGVGMGAFVGSSTESAFQDFLVMIPAGTTAVTNSSLTGSYRVGALDFLQGKSSSAREAYFTLTSTGNGTLGAVAMTGSAVNLGNTSMNQTVAGATYSFAQAPGSITFPLGLGTADAQLVSGTKTLYISADGNLLLGGSPNGFDILLGVRALAANTPPPTGIFYVAALEEDATNTANPLVDAFYGSVNGTASGINTWHERLNFVNETTFDDTFANSLTLDANGSSNATLLHYDIGANGRAFLMVGRGKQYTLGLGVHSDDFTPSGSVFLNPVGVANAAGFAPITNSVAPNEFISLFGTGLAPSTQVAQSLPLPTTLGGVRVTVNGRPAPLFFVSAQQINALIPSNLPEDYATIQVINNGVNSNPVTVYANSSAPAIFTLPPNGVSSAAALHSDFTLVGSSSPAKPGETILVYLTGLGQVAPSVPDGAAGPSNPLSMTTATTSLFIGSVQGTVTFSGLAPLFAGLYQVNVKLPANAVAGTQLLHLDTPDAVAEEATILVAGSATATGAKAAEDESLSSPYRPAHVRRPAGHKIAIDSGARRTGDQ